MIDCDLWALIQNALFGSSRLVDGCYIGLNCTKISQIC